MGYPKDLDEYDEEQLQGELARRARLKEKGVCTYCERPQNAPSCRFPERHNAAAPLAIPTLEIGDTSYDLTEAFCAGAVAFHDQIPYNFNPYRSTDDRHDEWSEGHTIASAEDNPFPREKAEPALAEAKARRL